MQNSEISSLQSSIERATAHIESGKAVERLRNNKDFKKIVIDGYFNQEAVRLVHLKGEPSMQKDDSQVSIVKQMDAIAAFSQYLTIVILQANQAEKQRVGDEETMAELLSEELN